MTSKTKQQDQGRQAPSGQMGGSGSAPQPQQSGDAPPQPGMPPKPVRYTDWASI